MTRTKKVVYSVLGFPVFWIGGGIVVQLMPAYGADPNSVRAAAIVSLVMPFVLIGILSREPSTPSK